MKHEAQITGEITIKTKRCKDCKEWKPIEYFYPSGRRKDGLGFKYQPYCKGCDLARSEVWRKNNLEKDRENSRKKRLRYGKHTKTFSTERSQMSGRVYKTGYHKLTKLQKENLVYKRLLQVEKHLTAEEIREIAEEISIGAFDRASKKIFLIKI